MQSQTTIKSYVNPSYISKFVELVNEGINSWCLAGEMLVKMHREDPNVIKNIHNQHSYLSVETLEIFFNIGLKVIHPHVALLPRRFVVPISKLTYKAQENVIKNPVVVVSHMVDNNPVVRNKPISKLSHNELKYAINKNGNATVAEQVKYLRTVKPTVKQNNSSTTTQRKPKSLGLFMIKRKSATEFELVRTGDRKYNTQTILLEDGKATVELKQWE